MIIWYRKAFNWKEVARNAIVIIERPAIRSQEVRTLKTTSNNVGPLLLQDDIDANQEFAADRA